MSKTCMPFRESRRKYKVRVRNRCLICGRPRGYYRRFKLCRICLREQAHTAFNITRLELTFTKADYHFEARIPMG